MRQPAQEHKLNQKEVMKQEVNITHLECFESFGASRSDESGREGPLREGPEDPLDFWRVGVTIGGHAVDDQRPRVG